MKQYKNAGFSQTLHSFSLPLFLKNKEKEVYD